MATIMERRERTAAQEGSSGLRRIFLFCLLLSALIAATILFSSPRLGTADNGDFYRLALVAGVDGRQAAADGKNPYFYSLREEYPYLPLHTENAPKLTERYGNFWPAMVVRCLTKLFSDTVSTNFYTWQLALVYYVFLLFGFGFWIRTAFKCLGKMGGLLFVAAAVFLLFGSMHLAWLNSFYGEALLFTGLIFTLGVYSAIYTPGEKRKDWHDAVLLLLAGGGTFLFLTAKAQNVLCAPLWIALLLGTAWYLFRKTDSGRWKALLCAVACLWTVWIGVCSVGVYRWNDNYNSHDTLYSSIMNGALCLTDTAEETEHMLLDMGLDPDLAADKGKHPYQNEESYYLYPRSEEAQTRLYDRISTIGLLKYYLTHPSYLFHAMEITAGKAIDPATDLIHVVKDPDSGVYHEGHTRFGWWEKLRPNVVPRHFWEYIVLFLLFFSFSVWEFVRARRKEGFAALPIFLMAIMLTGIVQYPLPFIGNGYSDTNKQLYPFMLCWDVSVLLVLTMALRELAAAVSSRKVFFSERTKRVAGAALWLLMPLVSFFTVEYLSFNSLRSMSFGVIAANLILYYCIYVFFTALTGHTAWGGTISASLLVVLGIVNHFTLLYRGTALLPTDIYSFKTAASVAGRYSFLPDEQTAAALVVLFVICTLLFRMGGKLRRKERAAAAILSTVLVFCAVLLSGTWAMEKLSIVIESWDQTESSKKNGFMQNMVGNLNGMTVSQPKSYSESRAAQLIGAAPSGNAKEPDVLPNIIAIMLESFSDPRNIYDFSVSEEPLEHFYARGEEENGKAGLCLVPPFGGSTSLSEYEFLTGNSNLFLGGMAPLQQYVRGETSSAAAIAAEAGYSCSVGINCASGKNWGRDEAYPLLGFSEFISEESPEFSDREIVHGWTSDASLVRVIEDKIDSEDALFLYANSMEGHGSYDDPSLETRVRADGLERDYPDLDQYLTLLEDTDEAMESLFSYLEESDEPTIVLLFGDHYPVLDTSLYEELERKSGIDRDPIGEDLIIHATPYLFWANYPVDFDEIPDVLSANFLAPYLFRAAGVQGSRYTDYLYSLSREYPVVSLHGIVDAEGNILQYDEDDPACSDILDYAMVQYRQMK